MNGGLVEINFLHMRIEWKSYCVYDTHAQNSCSHCDSVRSWTHFHSSLAMTCERVLRFYCHWDDTDRYVLSPVPCVLSLP